MKIARNLLAGCLLVGAFVRPAVAGNPNIVINDDDRHIDLILFDEPLKATEVECGPGSASESRDCSSVYSILYLGGAVNPGKGPRIVKATVDPDDPTTLHVEMEEPISLKRECTAEEKKKLDEDKKPCIYKLSEFRLILRRVIMGADEHVRTFNIPIVPTVTEDFGSRKSVIYRGVRLLDPPKPEDITIEVTASDHNDEPIATKVVKVLSASKFGEGKEQSNWRLYVDPPLARGQALDISVSGIEEYGEKELNGGGSIQVEDYPESRDDATFYLRGEKVFSRFGDDTGSVDFKLNQNFRRAIKGTEWWYLLDATVGSKSLDLSQTGTASVGYRRWLGVDADLRTRPAWNVSVAPTFRTDRDFKNRDLGLDLISELQPGSWYQTIEQRQKDNENPDIHSGLSAKAKFAFEGGQHLASSSEEVDGTTFLRAVAGFNFLLEKEKIFRLFDKVSLTVDVAGRYLARDEVTIDEDEVLKISDGFKPYLRAELAYGLGPVALSVVHENGKLPPNFKRAHATTVGLTVKF